jgi:hypothetical protein
MTAVEVEILVRVMVICFLSRAACQARSSDCGLAGCGGKLKFTTLHLPNTRMLEIIERLENKMYLHRS